MVAVEPEDSADPLGRPARPAQDPGHRRRLRARHPRQRADRRGAADRQRDGVRDGARGGRPRRHPRRHLVGCGVGRGPRGRRAARHGRQADRRRSWPPSPNATSRPSCSPRRERGGPRAAKPRPIRATALARCRRSSTSWRASDTPAPARPEAEPGGHGQEPVGGSMSVVRCGPIDAMRLPPRTRSSSSRCCPRARHSTTSPASVSPTRRFRACAPSSTCTRTAFGSTSSAASPTAAGTTPTPPRAWRQRWSCRRSRLDW